MLTPNIKVLMIYVVSQYKSFNNLCTLIFYDGENKPSL